MIIILEQGDQEIARMSVQDFPNYVNKYFNVGKLETLQEYIDAFNEQSTACTAVRLYPAPDEDVTAVSDEGKDVS